MPMERPFQSSPTPKGGCDVTFQAAGHSGQMFQSSPTPKGGCDAPRSAGGADCP